jgi:hypothetical protein
MALAERAFTLTVRPSFLHQAPSLRRKKEKKIVDLLISLISNYHLGFTLSILYKLPTVKITENSDKHER